MTTIHLFQSFFSLTEYHFLPNRVDKKNTNLFYVNSYIFTHINRMLPGTLLFSLLNIILVNIKLSFAIFNTFLSQYFLLKKIKLSA